MTVKFNTVEINGFRVPATFHDAILKIKDGFQKGKISFVSTGHYEIVDSHSDKNVCCPIGYLLTSRQRKQFQNLDEDHNISNDINNDAVWDFIGNDNLHAMLGMYFDHADHLQSVFDEVGVKWHNGDSSKECRTAFNRYLNGLLAEPNYDNPALAA
jgi:hypothetical protein